MLPLLHVVIRARDPGTLQAVHAEIIISESYCRIRNLSSIELLVNVHPRALVRTDDRRALVHSFASLGGKKSIKIMSRPGDGSRGAPLLADMRTLSIQGSRKSIEVMPGPVASRSSRFGSVESGHSSGGSPSRTHDSAGGKSVEGTANGGEGRPGLGVVGGGGGVASMRGSRRSVEGGPSGSVGGGGVGSMRGSRRSVEGGPSGGGGASSLHGRRATDTGNPGGAVAAAAVAAAPVLRAGGARRSTAGVLTPAGVSPVRTGFPRKSTSGTLGTAAAAGAGDRSSAGDGGSGEKTEGHAAVVAASTRPLAPGAKYSKKVWAGVAGPTCNPACRGRGLGTNTMHA